jgi:hypothetical protein
MIARRVPRDRSTLENELVTDVPLGCKMSEKANSQSVAKRVSYRKPQGVGNPAFSVEAGSFPFSLG